MVKDKRPHMSLNWDELKKRQLQQLSQRSTRSGSDYHLLYAGNLW